ncbi:AAA family ATPase (plasmid) [Paenibacillus thiaminolyticus]|uniref:AAA family ATPase n=1 Tax=Paenibacillus thiaminolyticus TaxID=49283 RepID=UPI00232F6B21|nr:AAA family ATPase [Paenibacillus thiaminolyticus]WCF11739.1 AAA family ATPase [Paenibacillus thiaminolyticus]
MKKILLAVGFRQLEEYLERNLKNEFKFVGVTVYREGVIRAIGQQNPDIVVIRETLEGKENILSIVYEIRNKFPKIRVVFIAGKREAGDVLLATLVSYGVYDILHGEKIQAQDVMALLREPNEYRDVQHLQPKPVFDERQNKVLFESPDVITVEKEVEKVVVKEIFIESVKDNEDLQIQYPEEVNSLINDTTPPPILDEKKDFDQNSKTSTEESELTIKENPKGEDENKPGGGFLHKLFGSIKVGDQGGPNSVHGKQKILTFMGAKSGLGNTTIALNTAIQLAQRKNRVIYIEINDRTPTVNYWYELGYLEDGIDSALSGVKTGDLDKVKQAIIHSETLAKEDSALQKNYKMFPETLDFMFFSNRYLTRNQEDRMEIDFSFTKEMYFFLLFQLEYDYLVLDVPADLTNLATMNALNYSNKTFITITQDVSAIGNSLYLQNELIKKGTELKTKAYFISNRHEKAKLDVKEIIEWMQVEDVLTVPCMNKELINANFVGIPIVLYSNNSVIKTSFQNIVKKII